MGPAEAGHSRRSETGQRHEAYDDAIKVFWKRNPANRNQLAALERDSGAGKLMPDPSALQDAAAARAADPLGLNLELWTRGYEAELGRESKAKGNETGCSAQGGEGMTEARSISPHPEDEVGAADFSDPEERQCYITARRETRLARAFAERREGLEKMRLSRMEAMGDAKDSSEDTESVDAVGGTPLTRAQFNLMVKTAAAVRSAAHPAQLEMKILANHRQDDRFNFLASQDPIWKRLRAGESIDYKSLVPAEKVEKAGGSVGQLLHGYDSEESNSDNDQATEEGAEPADPLSLSNNASGNDSTETQGLEVKRAERLARARLWAAQRRSAATATADESTDLKVVGGKEQDQSALVDSDLKEGWEGEAVDADVAKAWESEETLRIG
ncbi:unnamed protein product [Parajaminaea phylloscopi]